MDISNELITTLAPNAAALTNAKKISAKNGFIKLYKSNDDTLLMGECSGSGKSNYNVSVDFINSDKPVFRCNCPSRQIPCKHGLAILVDYISGKTFEEIDITEDIKTKREKLEARAEKKESEKMMPPKANKAVAAKKIKKQIEGLELAEKFVNDAVTAGLGALSGNSMKEYESLAKQLGDYYLPGAQVLVRRMILALTEWKKLNENSDRQNIEAIKYLIQLQALIKKSKAFLSNKLEQENVDLENSMLYESLGTIWKLSQLNELGLCEENAEVIQLSFDSIYDEARSEYVETGYWFHIQSGEISKTMNYRPLKALKYIKAEDTVFEVVKTPALYKYPGELNKRIRWEEFSFRKPTENDYKNIIEKSEKNLTEVVKKVKNQIKNTLSEKSAGACIAYRSIGKIDENYVLEDGFGNTILLKDNNNKCERDSVYAIEYLPDTKLLHDKVLFGLLFYEQESHRIVLQPYSIITENKIIRLLY